MARALLGVVEHCVGELAGACWAPSEIARLARRRAGAQAEQAVNSAIRSLWRSERGSRRDEGRDPAWPGEAAALAAAALVDWCPDPKAASWRSDVETGLSVIGLLMHLPALPGRRSVRALPDSSDAPDGRVLEKVRLLLSKAESTTFADEADALTAKAQELLSRYSIDSAALHLHMAGRMAGSRQGAQAAVRRLWIDEPYVMAKAQLLTVVCQANRSRSVITGSLGLATVVGHDDDLDTVEILFTSLLVQATTQMTAAGPKTDRFGRSRTRSFRQSFLVAYAVRIGQRLRAAQEEAVCAGAARHGDDLLPVLASRTSAADEVVRGLFPTLVGQRTAANDYEGWMAGTVAADLATLSYQPELADSMA